MYCASCGSEVEQEADFCPECGVPINANASAHHTVEATPGADANRQKSQVVGGLDRNVAGALTYVLGFLTGLIFYLLEEEDEFVRYHAAQSMVVFGGLFALGIAVSMFSIVLSFGNGIVLALVGILLSLFWLLISLGGLILWVYLIVSAYQGKRTRIPIAAGIADSLIESK